MSANPSGNGGWMQAAMSGLVTAGQAITKGGPKRQYKYNKKMANYQNQLNRENAEWILEQNKQLLAEQRGYDSPESQMARFKAAGLNPNLIYGDVGHGGAPISMPSLPNVNVGQVDSSYPDVAGDFMRAQMAQSQMGLVDAKTTKTEVESEIAGLQRAITANNPMLSPLVAQRTADVLLSTGELKLKEQSYLMQSTDAAKPRYMQKIDADVDAMVQKLGLNTTDLAIKNKILESKEYENALKEIQVKWMKDADITPQHIYQGLMLLLTKMM